MGMDRNKLKKIGAIVLATGTIAATVVGAAAASDLFDHNNPVHILQDSVMEPVQPTTVELQVAENTQLLKSLELEADVQLPKVKYSQLGC